MEPGMPGKPEVPDPNPQSYDTDGSQCRGWDHQGCLGHFQEGQGGHFQVLEAEKGHLGSFHNFSIVDLPLMEYTDGLSDIGLQGLHCILAQ